jgi:hypothetical protein
MIGRMSDFPERTLPDALMRFKDRVTAWSTRTDPSAAIAT